MSMSPAQAGLASFNPANYKPDFDMGFKANEQRLKERELALKTMMQSADMIGKSRIADRQMKLEEGKFAAEQAAAAEKSAAMKDLAAAYMGTPEGQANPGGVIDAGLDKGFSPDEIGTALRDISVENGYSPEEGAQFLQGGTAGAAPAAGGAAAAAAPSTGGGAPAPQASAPSIGAGQGGGASFQVGGSPVYDYNRDVGTLEARQARVNQAIARNPSAIYDSPADMIAGMDKADDRIYDRRMDAVKTASTMSEMESRQFTQAKAKNDAIMGIIANTGNLAPDQQRAAVGHRLGNMVKQGMLDVSEAQSIMDSDFGLLNASAKDWDKLAQLRISEMNAGSTQRNTQATETRLSHDMAKDGVSQLQAYADTLPPGSPESEQVYKQIQQAIMGGQQPAPQAAPQGGFGEGGMPQSSLPADPMAFAGVGQGSANLNSPLPTGVDAMAQWDGTATDTPPSGVPGALPPLGADGGEQMFLPQPGSPIPPDAMAMPGMATPQAAPVAQAPMAAPVQVPPVAQAAAPAPVDPNSVAGIEQRLAAIDAEEKALLGPNGPRMSNALRDDATRRFESKRSPLNAMLQERVKSEKPPVRQPTTSDDTAIVEARSSYEKSAATSQVFEDTAKKIDTLVRDQPQYATTSPKMLMFDFYKGVKNGSVRQGDQLFDTVVSVMNAASNGKITARELLNDAQVSGTEQEFFAKAVDYAQNDTVAQWLGSSELSAASLRNGSRMLFDQAERDMHLTADRAAQFPKDNPLYGKYQYEEATKAQIEQAINAQIAKAANAKNPEQIDAEEAWMRVRRNLFNQNVRWRIVD